MASVGVVSLQLGKLHGQTPVPGTITAKLEYRGSHSLYNRRGRYPL